MEEIEHRLGPARQIEERDNANQIDELKGGDAYDGADDAGLKTTGEGKDRGRQKGADFHSIAPRENANRAAAVTELQDIPRGLYATVERLDHEGGDGHQTLREGLDKASLGPRCRQHAEQRQGDYGEHTQILKGGIF